MIGVIIVEDDPMVLAINKEFLSMVEGFRLLGEADQIEVAKELIMKKKPNLILLDVFFPGGHGMALLKWLRQEEIQSDVILITADKTSETVSEAFRYGAVDYLIKPFKFQRFEEALKRYRLLKNNLHGKDKVDQGAIDAFTHSDSESDLMDQLSEEEIRNQTFDMIVQYIQKNQENPFTSQFIADELGISRITARKYLDYLEKIKVLSIELEYGAIGRPKNIYKYNQKKN